MHRYLYLIILLVGGVLVALVQWNARVSLNRELASYRAESADETRQSAQAAEQSFNAMYRAARTIARLPGVQAIAWDEPFTEMDRSGSVLDENTRLTIQEIYNALAIDVAVSELYIVPVTLDPDGIDPTGQSPREPLITFDEFIIGRTGAETPDDDHDDHGHHHVQIEEIEIFEYRLMREQLDWMAEHYPDSGRIMALDYPAVSGEPVITCDNSRFDPAEPDDEHREGLVLSVPIFDDGGMLRGCVSAVMLTGALADHLESGNYAIFNTGCEHIVSTETRGEWHRFAASGALPIADRSLLYSEVLEIRTADRIGQWYFWAGLPDSAFWSRNDVAATMQARTIGFAAVLIVTLGAVAGTMIVQGSYRRIAEANSSLEAAINERTSDLLQSRDMAVQSLEREKQALAEKDHALKVLESIASTDKLTGLPNRTVFLDRLQQLLRQSRRSDSKFAVLFFDFDRFKIVNDSLGHDVGDALLCSIAETFRNEIREGDTAARFGGDEFVVLISNLTDFADARKKAEKMLEAFSRPHFIDENLIVSTASIGLVTNEHHYQTPQEMIRDADAAMYQAKENGKAQVVEFDKAMHEEAMKRLQIESDLRNALDRDEFKLEYQPIFSLEDGGVHSLEALLRWHHPIRGLVSPNDFIGISEDTGLICEIGKWVLWEAASFIASLNKDRPDNERLGISINVSKRQLLEQGFIEDVLECKRSLGLGDRELQLEITESVIVDAQSGFISLLEALRDHHILIAMDDFGTGVSSLSLLNSFPIDVIKIDQSFVFSLNGDRSLLAVVSSIANLADNLGIQTVAEGIESGAVIGALQSMGCTWGQGFHYARPMPGHAVEEFLRSCPPGEFRAA